ncbi:MAG TPA: restriction endonuclease subunit S [Anaerolineales bacterium]|nr:restriction endonuclease subunit S [Anaerolineales bacterium]
MSCSSINTWSKQPLKNIATLISSGGTPSRKHPEYYSNNGHLWVKSKELLDTSIYDTEEHISDIGLKNSSAKYFPQNTILVAMYGANVGQLAILKQRATVNQAICGLVVDDSLANYRFIFYTLLSTRHKLAAKAYGAAQQNLNQDLIRNFEIPFPPLLIQRKIAAILSAYDDLIENNTRRIQILEEMAQALYREWFVEFKFPGHDKVKMVESELGMVPEGWKVVKVGDVSKVGRGSSPRPIIDQIYFEGGMIPWIKIADATNSGKYLYKTKEKVNEYGASFSRLLPKGSLIIAASGTLGYTQLLGVKGCIHDGWLYLMDFEGVVKDYLYYLFSSKQAFFYNSAYGAAIQNINTMILREMEILLPPYSLQCEFAKIISDNDALLQNIDHKNSYLRHTRDLLLPKLISGEVDVSSLDITTGETT